MSKKVIAAVIIVSVFFGVLFNVLFGRFIAAQVSMMPIFNRWNIIQPQAPIIIERRQEVRVTDGGDLLQAAAESKSRLSFVFYVKDGQWTEAGSAINITSAGSFLTSVETFKTPGAQYYVMSSDGLTAPIIKTAVHKTTGIMFFQASLENVAVATFGQSEALVSGERIFYMANSSQPNVVRFKASFVSRSQNDTSGQRFNSDVLSRSFLPQDAGVMAGQAVINLRGEIVGIWAQDKIVSSDVLKQITGAYLSGIENFAAMTYGFSYNFIGPAEAQELNLTLGSRVLEVRTGTPAFKSGLLTNDIIVKLNNTAITQDEQLEELLQRIKPGEKAQFEVIRKSQRLTLEILAEN